MKKAFDQTLRDIKRGVNRKVLKVPCIEQKVLDATSNEPWGPHGSLLADIAEATRRYPHEYQITMSVLWKRINDTGKNWRHVYKALTVMEYLVAHGSERVIDEIKEHAYQISTLSDFQYIDSSGRDQGNNVRKKSQSLVILVNDKERIHEARQKATANREKYHNTSVGLMYKSGSFSSSGGYGDQYDDDQHRGRYANRDDVCNGYRRERDYHARDEDRYGRYRDSYGLEADRYTKDYEERLGRGRYQDDDYRGRDQSIDGYQYGSRSRSADQERDCAYEYASRYSRGSHVKADDHGSTVAMRLERKFSEQNLPPPPDLEELAAHSPIYSERDGERSLTRAPETSSSHPSGSIQSHATAVPTPHSGSLPAPASAQAGTQGGAGIDSMGHSSKSFSSNSLAYAFGKQQTMTPKANASNLSSELALVASSGTTPVDDPFGDGPFKALPSTDSVAAQQQITTNSTEILNVPKTIPQKPANEFVSTPTNTQFVQKEPSTFNLDVDILADILPPSSASYLPSQGLTGQSAGFPSQPGQPSMETDYALQSAESASQSSSLSQSIDLTLPMTVQASQASHTDFHAQSHKPTSSVGFPSQMGSLAMQPNPSNPNFYGASQTASSVPHAAHMVPLSYSGPIMQHNFLSQSGPAVRVASQPGPQAPQLRPSSSMAPASAGSSCTVKPSKDKFETKSTVWTDTLSRGLVNLNISGPKINPLADIGVDFDAINRKERRMEKPTTTTVTSTVSMGKAMGSGSGIGHAGASALRPPPNPMIGPGMAMGGYGVGQQMGNGMGMGMGQGFYVQQQNGYPLGSTIRGVYNPLMGTGNYGQQPYGGGYR